MSRSNVKMPHSFSTHVHCTSITEHHTFVVERHSIVILNWSEFRTVLGFTPVDRSSWVGRRRLAAQHQICPNSRSVNPGFLDGRKRIQSCIRTQKNEQCSISDTCNAMRRREHNPVNCRMLQRQREHVYILQLLAEWHRYINNPSSI
jgi:hypothetical protein